MSDPIHQRDISQSTLVSLKFISYFNAHFYTSIVIVTHEPFAYTPRERGKYSQMYLHLPGLVIHADLGTMHLSHGTHCCVTPIVESL